jgi:hypothetical protein
VSRVGATSAEDPIEELFARGVTFRSPENLKMLVAGGTAGRSPRSSPAGRSRMRRLAWC